MSGASEADTSDPIEKALARIVSIVLKQLAAVVSPACGHIR